jgi:hypothetical protein
MSHPCRQNPTPVIPGWGFFCLSGPQLLLNAAPLELVVDHVERRFERSHHHCGTHHEALAHGEKIDGHFTRPMFQALSKSTSSGRVGGLSGSSSRRGRRFLRRNRLRGSWRTLLVGVSLRRGTHERARDYLKKFSDLHEALTGERGRGAASMGGKGTVAACVARVDEWDAPSGIDAALVGAQQL